MTWMQGGDEDRPAATDYTDHHYHLSEHQLLAASVQQQRIEREYAERHGSLLTFLVRGDFARGQRTILVDDTYIGSFAGGQRELDGIEASNKLVRGS